MPKVGISKDTVRAARWVVSAASDLSMSGPSPNLGKDFAQDVS
jgi:hypothetical protein